MSDFQYPYESIDVNDELTPEDLADGIDELQAQADERKGPIELGDPRHPFFDDPSEGFGYWPGEDERPSRRVHRVHYGSAPQRRRTWHADFNVGDVIVLNGTTLEDDETGQTDEWFGLVRLAGHDDSQAGWYVEPVSDGSHRGALIEHLNRDARAGIMHNLFLSDWDFIREVDPHYYGEYIADLAR